MFGKYALKGHSCFPYIVNLHYDSYTIIIFDLNNVSKRMTLSREKKNYQKWFQSNIY